MRKAVWILLCWMLTNVHLLAQKNAEFSPIDKVGALMYYLQTFYVDTLNENNLTEHAIEAILKELDPHSYYVTAKELKDEAFQFGPSFTLAIRNPMAEVP